VHYLLSHLYCVAGITAADDVVGSVSANICSLLSKQAEEARKGEWAVDTLMHLYTCMKLLLESVAPDQLPRVPIVQPLTRRCTPVSRDQLISYPRRLQPLPLKDFVELVTFVRGITVPRNATEAEEKAIEALRERVATFLANRCTLGDEKTMGSVVNRIMGVIFAKYLKDSLSVMGTQGDQEKGELGREQLTKYDKEELIYDIVKGR
jgi:hypothetical protein